MGMRFCRRGFRYYLIVLLFIVLSGCELSAATWTFTGGTWGDSMNWGGTLPPNDGTADVTITRPALPYLSSGIIFLDGDYNVRSLTWTPASLYNNQAQILSTSTAQHTLTLQNGLTSTSGGWIQLYQTNIVLGAFQTWDLACTKMALYGTVSGPGGIEKTGTGTLLLSSATNNYTGGTVIRDGVFQVPAATSLGDASSSVEIDGGTLRFGLSVAVSGYTATIDRPITIGNRGAVIQVFNGTAMLTGALSGPGQLCLDYDEDWTTSVLTRYVLSGSNSYSGGTSINASTVTVSGTNQSLGAGLITLNSRSVLRLNSAANLAPGQKIAMKPLSALVLVDPAMDPASIIDKTNTTGGILALPDGAEASSLDMSAIGNGALFLGTAGDVTYTGNTLRAGVGAVYRLGGGSSDATSNLRLTFAGTDNLFTGTNSMIIGGSARVIGSGGYDNISSATIVFRNTNNYSGDTIFNSGTILIGGDAALGSGTLIINNDTTMGDSVGADGGAHTLLNPVLFNNALWGWSLFITGTSNLAFGGPVDLGSQARMISGSRSSGITTFSNSIKNGTLWLSSGSWELSGSNDCGFVFTNYSTVAVSNGANLATTGTSTIVLDNATLHATASFTTSSPFTITANGATILTGDNTVQLSGTISGSGTLHKQDTGTLALSGSGKDFGGLEVANGAVILNHTGNTNHTAIKVSGSASLSGIGSVGSASVAAGGHLSPGGQEIGVLVLNGDLVVGGGANLDFALGSANADKIVLSALYKGQNGTININILDAGGMAPGQTYTLLDWSKSPLSTTIKVSDFQVVTCPLPGALSIVNNTLQFTTASQEARFTVSSTANDGPGSLREAILLAMNAGAATIDLSNLTGTITLESPLPDITSNLTLKGPGAAQLRLRCVEPLNGENPVSPFRVLTIKASAAVNVQDLTISDGSATQGAGIFNGGRLTLTRTVLEKNSAISHDGPSVGGAIYNDGSLIVNDSTISENTVIGTADDGEFGGCGGGVYVADVANPSALAILHNCTISGNLAHALLNGHGVANASGGGIYSEAGAIYLYNCTISGNKTQAEQSPSAAGSNTAHGGGISGKGSLVNCTVTDNTVEADVADCAGADSVYGTNCIFADNELLANNPTSGMTLYWDAPANALYHCIVAKLTKASTFDTNFQSQWQNQIGSEMHPVNVRLQPLANNGGPTLTHAIFPDSPAFDAGDDSVTAEPQPLTTDQRGTEPRKLGAHVDIGAFEFDQNTSAGKVIFSATNYSANEGDDLARITVQRLFGTNGTLTVHYEATDGTAIAGVNFTPASGEITFEPGQDSATFDIPILDDDIEEGMTTVNLVLANPQDKTDIYSASVLSMSDNDNAAPAVTVTSPANYTRVFDATVTLAGAAIDNGVVRKVQVQQDDGDWADAQGTDHWSFTAEIPSRGLHTFRVKSTDAVGNESPVVTTTIERVINSILAVVTDGNGTVSPNFAGTSIREVGETYTIAATPVAGAFFQGWWLNNQIISDNPVLQIEMQENLSLVARFGSSPFSKIHGTFRGVVSGNATGILVITTTAKGSFSGKLVLNGTVYPVRGSFANSDYMTVNIVKGDGQPLSISLHINAADDPSQLAVTINDETETYDIAGTLPPWNPQSHLVPSNIAGRFTVLFPASSSEPAAGFPSGDGWGTLSITRSGNVVLIGALADGTRISYGTMLTSDYSWPLYISLYGNSGSLSGTVALVAGDPWGELRWFKPANDHDRYFQKGFPLSGHSPEISLEGKRYDSSLLETRTSTTLNQAVLTLTRSDSSESIEQPVIIGSSGQIKAPLPNPLRLSIKINRLTGQFMGTLLNPSLLKVPFSGVFVGSAQTGAGFFLSPAESGRLDLGPQP
jgi:autotransporter-associated beta strand protein